MQGQHFGYIAEQTGILVNRLNFHTIKNDFVFHRVKLQYFVVNRAHITFLNDFFTHLKALSYHGYRNMKTVDVIGAPIFFYRIVRFSNSSVFMSEGRRVLSHKIWKTYHLL